MDSLIHKTNRWGMEKVRDIGVVDIDNLGYLNRWYGGDRKKCISDHLPEGPGWVPEHYVSYICNFADGAWIPPKFLTHHDGVILNNDPTNIRLPKIFKDPTEEEYGEFRPDSKSTLSHRNFEKILGGFYQNKTLIIPKIKRCGICGIPIFGEPYGSGCVDMDLCTDCYRDFYIDEDEVVQLTLLTSPDNDLIDNLYIDHMRGLDFDNLHIKYKNFPNVDFMLNQISSGKYNKAPFF